MNEDKRLKPEHLKAIQGYMRGMNKSEALTYAGYTYSYARTRAKDVFGREDVQAEIARRQRGALRRAEIDESWIVKKLKEIVEADPGELLQIDPSEAKVGSQHFAKLSPAIRAAMDVEYTPTGVKIKVTAAARVQALKMLGDYIGMWKQKVEITGDEDVISLIEGGRARAAKKNGDLAREKSEDAASKGIRAGHA